MVIMRMDKKILLGLLAVAFLIRAYTAANMAQANADEILYNLIAVGTATSPWHRLSTLFHGPIYFYLTDLAYVFFGVNFFSARLVSVIFSAISMLLVYLLGKELFDQKTGLIASFIFAFSAAQIYFGSLGLLDVPATALSMLSMLFLLRWNKNGGRKELLLSFGVYAVAITAKISQLYLAPFFLLVLAHGAIARKRANLRDYAFAALAFVLLVMPVPAYNYLLFSDKGLADFHVSRALSIDSAKGYFREQSVAGIDDAYFNISHFNAAVPYMFTLMLAYFSIPLLLFFVIGIVEVAKKRTMAAAALLAWLLVPLLSYLFYVFHDYYLAVLMPPIAIIAAVGLQALGGHFARFANAKTIVSSLLFILIVWEVAMLLPHISGKPAIYQLEEQLRLLPGNSTVVMDDAIWTGTTLWMGAASGKEVMSLSLFDYGQHGLVGKGVPRMTDIYAVSCVPGNCGWSSLDDAARDNSERLKADLHGNGTRIAEIYGADGLEYEVYRMRTAVSPVGHISLRFLGYITGHPERAVDVYGAKWPVGVIVDSVAHASLLMDLLVALGVPIAVLVLLLKEN